MPGLLKIDDEKANGALAFDLSQLLALVSEEGAQWAWSVFPMGEGTHIVGDVSATGMTVPELEEKVNRLDEGVLLSWDQMKELGEGIFQTIWGTFVACRDAACFSRLLPLYLDESLYINRASDEYYETVEAAFQAVDSSFWLVYAKDGHILQRIIAAFRKVEVLRVW